MAEELALAPWALTANFADARLGRCQLTLAGVADPTGVGAGYSYTRLRTAKETAEARSKARGKSKVVGSGGGGGADAAAAATAMADLRRMTKAEAVRLLASEGEARDEVKKLSRADCIAQ